MIQKIKLRDGYYYAGYIHQNACVISPEQPLVVGQWNLKRNCFFFWEYEGNRKSKQSIPFFGDLDNEIETGFLPTKEIIPKEEHILE